MADAGRPICPECMKRGMRRTERHAFACLYCGFHEHDVHCTLCTKGTTFGELDGRKVPYHFWEVNHLASDRAPLATKVWLGREHHGVRFYQVELTYTERDYVVMVHCPDDELDAEDPRVLVTRRGRAHAAWERCPFGTQRIHDLKQAAMAAVDGAPGTPLWAARGYGAKKAG